MRYGFGPQSQRAYEDLRAAIVAGQFPIGARLPSQTALAADLGVAPLTLRQALIRPEDEGLVSREQGRGTFVRSHRATGPVPDGEAYARLEQALRESEERFRATFEHAGVGIAHHNLNGDWLLVNQRLLELYGYSREELLTLDWQEITVPEDLDTDLAQLDRLLRGEIDTYSLERRYIRKDGSILWAHVSISLVREESGEPKYFVAVVEDIGERKRAEEALEHEALHDSLTGLPNRTLLFDRLQRAIAAARRDDAELALVLMDLDGFKEVNDTFGHHYGDLLLQQVAKRLERALRESDTVARLGGDEFAVLLRGADEGGAITAAEKLLKALAEPIKLDGQGFDIEASMGIAVYPAHGDDANTLLRRADVAMYAAKRAEIGLALYTSEYDRHSRDRLALTQGLREAIEHDELLLHYQPKVELATGQATSVEALVRWVERTRGPVSPEQFIPVAEHSGLIKPLTIRVLTAALRQCRSWFDAGLNVTVAVNLSARSLHDQQLLDMIAHSIRRWAIAPSWLTVEITESAVMTDPTRAMHVLSQLHRMGVRISIDDFGTGYSSLASLKRLPVDEIKIDRSFVSDMAVNRDDATIVRSVIDLGHNLGLKVVAEGVEDEATAGLLRGLGCDTAQGFYFSRPLPVGECAEWLRSRRVSVALELPAADTRPYL